VFVALGRAEVVVEGEVRTWLDGGAAEDPEGEAAGLV